MLAAVAKQEKVRTAVKDFALPPAHLLGSAQCLFQVPLSHEIVLDAAPAARLVQIESRRPPQKVCDVVVGAAAGPVAPRRPVCWSAPAP